jgi:hypothetical protein
MPSLLWFLAVAMGSPGTSILNQNPAPVAQDATISKFSDRIQTYVPLQKKLERSLPVLKTSDDAAEIQEHILALREKIPEARSGVQQGNIFPAEISAHFKIVIRKTFLEPVSQIVRRTVQESDPSKPMDLRVENIYPDTGPVLTTPPTLPSRLPELPMELMYRILGHTFVLLNSKTRMGVDFIPDAIP